MKFSRVVLASIFAFLPQWQLAQADEMQAGIDWSKLNLSPQQAQQIHYFEQQWNKDYMTLQPSIIEDQRKLAQLLSDPKSDPVEIMAMQQNISRKKEQLRSAATTNYLHKRQILNGNQQHQLEFMIRQVVAERQRMLNPASESDGMSDRIQNLMQKVRNVWPRQ